MDNLINNFPNRVYADISIEPKPAPRPRLGRNGGVYNEDWYTKYKTCIANTVYRQIGGVFIEKELAIDIVFVKKLKPESKRYGDCDNLAKGVMDALIGVLYPDDSLITSLTVKKRFSQDPQCQGIHISIYF